MNAGSLCLLGLRHAYHAWLPEAPRTSALVALHGFGVTGYRTFRYIAPQLRGAGVPVYAPDLLGFGGSEKPENGYSLRRYAALTLAFTEALDLERPFLLGHSFGGKVAAATAALYPGRFAGLILVNPGGFSVFAPWLPLVADVPGVAWLFRQDWFARRVLPRTPLGSVFPDQASIRQFLRWCHAHRALDLDHAGLRPALRRLALPTLLIWGDDDPILPRSTVRRLLRGLPHADVRRIPDAGHAPMKDQPDAFAEAVLAFLPRSSS